MRQTYLIFSICIALALVGTAEAASKYKVTPRVIDQEVDRRDIFTEFITLENLSTHKISIYPTVNEIVTTAGGDIAEFVPPSMERNKAESITTWIEITRAGIELLPGEVREIPISFQIHKDAPAGNYQAFIGFGTGHNRDIAMRQVAEGQAPGTIITLAVEQNQTEFLKLGKFTIDKFVVEPDNNAITYTLANPGEAPVIPTGEIIFYNGRGEEVNAIPVNPDKQSLVPGQETSYTTNAPTAGMLGKYKAFLSVDYGSAQVASVYDTVYYYAAPWQKLAIIFVGVMVLAITLTLLLYRRMQASAPEHSDGTATVPLYVYEGTSPEQEHDINLKK